jgi:orotate phosphoribosyltransferase
MNEEERKAYAEFLIKDHAEDVEYLSIFEMEDLFRDLEEDDEISEEDARKVLDLIHSAKIEVSWE